MKKTYLTGLKPTGRLHLGNYFGAVKKIIDLQETSEYDVILFIADLHALTSDTQLKNPKKLRQESFELLLDLVSCGVNPKKIKIYRQSDFPQLAELMWLLNCFTTLPYAKRSHAYKDADDKGMDVTIGLLSYPMLMAADILLPDSDIVPVGKDQYQHIEIARDMARKFNQTYGEYFKEPKSFEEDDELVLGTDGKKMSKSHNNTIFITDSEENIKNAVSKIVTDSKSQDEPKDKDSPIVNIYTLFEGSEEVLDNYLKGGVSYKEMKEKLSELIIEKTKDFRKSREELLKDENFEEGVYSKHREDINKLFNKRMEDIRKKIGLIK